MKAFKFKLHKVFDVRKIEEELAGNELSRVNQELNQIRDEKKKLSSEQLQLYDYIRLLEQRSPEEVIQARDYMFFNRHQIELKNLELSQKQEEKERCQLEYVEKKKRKDVLEKLKQKQYNRYYREFLKTEQKELDDIAGQNGKTRGGVS